MQGLDYSTRQNEAYVKSQGFDFICRYLSYSPGKNINRAEADAALAAGLSIVLVWETYANRVMSGYSGGQADAQAAYAQAQGVGQPINRPIYFAVDFDTSERDWPLIEDYFRGVRDLLGFTRTGAYGEADIIDHLYECGLIAYGWQTYAWSGGRVSDNACLYQYSNGEWNDTVDFNEAKRDDFGQWPFQTQKIETEEDDDMRMESATDKGRWWTGYADKPGRKLRILSHYADEKLEEPRDKDAYIRVILGPGTDKQGVPAGGEFGFKHGEIWEMELPDPAGYYGKVAVEVNQSNAVVCYIV